MSFSALMGDDLVANEEEIMPHVSEKDLAFLEKIKTKSENGQLSKEEFLTQKSLILKKYERKLFGDLKSPRSQGTTGSISAAKTTFNSQPKEPTTKTTVQVKKLDISKFEEKPDATSETIKEVFQPKKLDTSKFEKKQEEEKEEVKFKKETKIDSKLKEELEEANEEIDDLKIKLKKKDEEVKKLKKKIEDMEDSNEKLEIALKKFLDVQNKLLSED